MKCLNASPENGRRNGVVGLGLIPGHVPSTISVKVYYGHNQYELFVPSNSNFGYLKSLTCQHIGLNPGACKIIFGGVEKEDDEDLLVAGVMNNSEVLLKVMDGDGKISEEVQGTSVISKGEDAVAEVRTEVDKLAQKVSELQAVADGGNKVDDKDIVYLSEMLMRQLLKLDGIEAEGEGRIQRKSEVRRVQSLVETLDKLKSRTRSSSSKPDKNFSEASNSSCEIVNTPLPMPSSSPCPDPHFTPSIPSHVPYYDPSQFSYSNPSHGQYYDHSQFSYSNPPHGQYYDPSHGQYYNPTQVSYFTPTTPYPVPYYDPAHFSHLTPSTLPSSTHSRVPYYDPSHMPSSAPFSMPPTEVTQNWEHFN